MLSFFSEYLSPANSIALGIVICLICFFIAWLVGLIAYWRILSRKRTQIENNQDIQPLVTARQKRDRGRDGNEVKTDANPVFQDFCAERSLSENSFISKHLKAIFLAGWNESRLEVSELINHTTSNLFRWNSLFRSVLAVFIVIGLLGTLFGLTDSLVELSPALKASAEARTPTENGGASPAANVDSENSRQMTRALSDLMDDIKGAFAPSIAGVFFTVLGVILYGIFLRFACHPVKSTLEQSTLTVWVPQLYPTTSQKLIQTLQESEAQMRSGYETAVRVDGMVENIQTNVDEFNKSLTQANAITEPLAESGTKINAAASSISTAADELNKGFTESLNDFADVLNKGFLQRLSEFSDKFTSSVTQLTGFQDQIRKLHEAFQKDANQKLDRQTEKLDDQNKNITQIIAVIEQILNALKSYETAYINSREEISKELQEFISKATDTNTSIYTENRKWFEDINNANKQQFSEMQYKLKTEIGDIQQTLKSQLDDLTTRLVRNLENVQQGLDSGLATLNERLENFDTPLKETVEEIKGVFDERLTTLNEQLEKLPEPIQESADQMRGTFADLVTFMRGIVGNLQQEIREQNEKYEAQLTGVKSLNESVKNLLTQLDESSKNQRTAISTLNSKVENLTGNTQDLAAAITSFTLDAGAISQSTAAIKEHTETLGTASQQFVKKVEKADVTPLNENIGSLNKTINEIAQTSQTLETTVDRLARQIHSSEPEQQPKRSFFKRIWNLFARKKTSGQSSSDSQNDNEGK